LRRSLVDVKVLLLRQIDLDAEGKREGRRALGVDVAFNPPTTTSKVEDFCSASEHPEDEAKNRC